MNLPNRKSIRLKGFDYSQNGVYFVTICTQNRQHILGSVGVDLCVDPIDLCIDHNHDGLTHSLPLQIS